MTEEQQALVATIEGYEITEIVMGDSPLRPKGGQRGVLIRYGTDLQSKAGERKAPLFAKAHDTG